MPPLWVVGRPWLGGHGLGLQTSCPAPHRPLESTAALRGRGLPPGPRHLVPQLGAGQHQLLMGLLRLGVLVGSAACSQRCQGHLSHQGVETVL